MIQIDMQMPERCGVCFAMYTDEFSLESGCGIDETARDLSTADINTKRPEWCPLKEQEAQKFFVDESGKITPLPVVVRCKDCKWRGTNACFCKARDDVQDDWFCSEGERKMTI